MTTWRDRRQATILWYDTDKRRDDGSTGHGGHDHLKGHVGAWSPRQPQWQHWGALWFTGMGCSCAWWQTGVVSADGRWCAVERVQRVCERGAMEVEGIVAVGGATRGEGGVCEDGGEEGREDKVVEAGQGTDGRRQAGVDR